MGGGGAEDWVNSCSPGLTKTICRVSAGITVHCNVQRVGGGMGGGGGVLHTEQVCTQT